ncbi:hypothetical protein KAR91_83770 [Candidatus Pacearchaeota archaeon]|nr:hypothetical protein [Candidatus Pacearchaeota archaeon]
MMKIERRLARERREDTKCADLYKLERIELRRVINQHNIDCYVLGVPSNICSEDFIYHVSGWEPSHYYREGQLPCNRCRVRDDMEEHPSRAFIGYTIQRGEACQ